MIKLHIEYDDFGEYVEAWDEESDEMYGIRPVDHNLAESA